MSAPAVEVEPDLDLDALAVAHPDLQYLVCDEAQFYTPEQCDQLSRVVDDLGIDVYAFGLITDFRGVLFEGTKRLLEVADERVAMQVEARCWCGARATHNARLVNGTVVYEGDVVVVGDTGPPSRPCSVTSSRTSCCAGGTGAQGDSREARSPPAEPSPRRSPAS